MRTDLFELLIVTGMSGSGKSKALINLEDSGYYCLDNLPMNLLSKVIDWMVMDADFPRKVALTADARNHDILNRIEKFIDDIDTKFVNIKILFLDCEDSVLLKRYKESRRLHPLMSWDENIDLATAISSERKLLSSLKDRATFVIDTTLLSTSQFKEKINSLLSSIEHKEMNLSFVAFGYKYGIPADADLVFDVRCLPNPFYIEDLREKTGADLPVQEFVMSNIEARTMFDRIKDYLEYTIPLYKKEGKGQLVVCLGCTGGQHRSLVFAQKLYEHFKSQGLHATLEARDLTKNVNEVISRKKQ